MACDGIGTETLWDYIAFPVNSNSSGNPTGTIQHFKIKHNWESPKGALCTNSRTESWLIESSREQLFESANAIITKKRLCIQHGS